MSERFDRLLTWVMAGAAVVVALTLVHNEFFSPQARMARQATNPKPIYVPDWTTMLPSGIAIGNPKAPVKIVEFADFECVECKEFEGTLHQMQAKYGDSLAVVFIDYPSPRHRFARPAAQAAECADQQGRFRTFHDVVYEKQDSIGLKPWTSYAAEAGVPDTSRFGKCASSPTEPPRIVAASALGIKSSIGFGPTVLVNGWRFRTPPSDSALDAAVAALLSGGKPQ